MGLVNLHEVDRVIEANRITFERYTHALREVPGISLLQPGAGEDSNYQYVVAVVEAGAALATRSSRTYTRRVSWPGGTSGPASTTWSPTPRREAKWHPGCL